MFPPITESHVPSSAGWLVDLGRINTVEITTIDVVIVTEPRFSGLWNRNYAGGGVWSPFGSLIQADGRETLCLNEAMSLSTKRFRALAFVPRMFHENAQRFTTSLFF
jgi:hypothetical protein